MSSVNTVASELKIVATDAEKFLKGAEQEFEKLFKKAPTTLQQISNFITFVSPEVVTIEGLLDPVAEPATVAAISLIQADISVLSTAIKSIDTATTAQQALTNLQTNLGSLLQIGEIKNPTVVKAVTGTVSTVINVLKTLAPAFASYVQNLGASTSPAPASQTA